MEVRLLPLAIRLLVHLRLPYALVPNRVIRVGFLSAHLRRLAHVTRPQPAGPAGRDQAGPTCTTQPEREKTQWP